MRNYVLNFSAVDRTMVGAVGGKGASLGELSRLAGVNVPPGFCLTASAYQQALDAASEAAGLLDRLSRIEAEDQIAIGEISGQLRRVLQETPVPQGPEKAVTAALRDLGPASLYAVRSSATAEDLPDASFAGQQDSYLNVSAERVVQHVRLCWASLFTERAIAYRIRNGFEHGKVRMAVVVQKMVPAQAAGVLFTADPVTGNRKVVAVETVRGLGQDLVGGLVSPDRYKLRDGHVVERAVAAETEVLNGDHLVCLERLGRRVEEHFGHPQDIEWCLFDDQLHLVQSRPITTLFPLPRVEDEGYHVYVSVGHQQMMTDAMKPFGLSFFQLTAGRPMLAAGGRLFVDVSPDLRTKAGRHVVLNVLGRSDPLVGEAVRTLLDRGTIPEPTAEDEAAVPPGQAARTATLAGLDAPIADDPAVVTGLIEHIQASIATLRESIQGKTGTDLLDFVRDDVKDALRTMFGPQNLSAIVAGMNATTWLNDTMLEWLGETGVAGVLSQSVANNITSEMGLELLAVADVLRPYPEVVAYLQEVEDEGFLEREVELDGWPQTRDAIAGYLARYGMRCAGEIDITRDRWSERPTTLIPLLLSNVKTFEPGAGRRLFEQGQRQAYRRAEELVEQVRCLPGGEEKAAETRRVIERLRNFIGYREYPKYGLVNRYFIYKTALRAEAERLVQANVLEQASDMDYLTFDELREAVATHKVDAEMLARRKSEHEHHKKLRPPRVMTSDGEVVTGTYQRRSLPPGALAGLAVSSGVVEGRARVILDIAQADLEPGDILVTAFTDPSWTPMFLLASALVTEVGGLMTHGAVIAREYGLPAVVGVENATRLIRDGQRIRVDGTHGQVEILS